MRVRSLLLAAVVGLLALTAQPAITIVDIPSIGSPAGDPGCSLNGTLYVPDPLVHPPPWHCMVGTHSPGFAGSNTLGTLVTPMTDLANAGYLSLAFAVRSLEPITGQTTTGVYHQQTDDFKIGVRFMRNNPGGLGYDVTGTVGAIGGSGSAHHDLWAALDGTAGDDKVDAAICLSPVTDMSDRQGDVSQGFIDIVVAYGNSTNLPTLLAESPISLPLAGAKPIRLYIGNNENMPLSQGTLFNSAMISAGATGFTYIVNTGSLGTQHSFAMWPDVSAESIVWLNQVMLVQRPARAILRRK